MQIFRNSKGLKRKTKQAVLTLGNFDGLHLGHQRIIRKVRERAASLGVSSVVYTFEPHPLKVVAPNKSPALILDIEDKARIIEALGIDYMVIARFTKEFAARHPREFVEAELRPVAADVCVGHDFSFGKGKTGTADYLKELGEELGFGVHVIPAYKKGGEVVSSSRIRRRITEGEVMEAAALLGRNFAIKGKVVRGRTIGKEIGFPTANIRTQSEIVPGDGVYAAFAVVKEIRHRAVVNIGRAPTFGGKERSIEVHILGFRDNIYGKRVRVEFVRRLRGEKAFASTEALQRQIRRDIKRSERILVNRD